jgi:hypothetical protein
MMFYPYVASKFPTTSTNKASCILPTMLSYTKGCINVLKNVLHKVSKFLSEEKIYKKTKTHQDNVDFVLPVNDTDSIVLSDESTYNYSEDENDGGNDIEIEILHYDDMEDYSDIHDGGYMDDDEYDIEIVHYEDLEDLEDTDETTDYDITSTIIGDSCVIIIILTKTNRA